MLKRIFALIGIVCLIATIPLWMLSAPRTQDAKSLPDHTGDRMNGERMFWIGGCSSCHATPGAKGEEKLRLGGGLALKTPFGVFNVPNISPDAETGIGGWSALDLVNAMQRGVSPQGRHYYPAFPYTSYVRMETSDIIDLKAFLDTLPAVRNVVADHELAFPYNIRRGLGLWKLAYLNDAPVVDLPQSDALALRGRYLVEGPGHCGECHTPRDFAGGLKPEAWLSGAPNLEGKGVIPNITPHSDGLATWSADDIASYLETGFSPDFEVVGGSMRPVQENLAKLDDVDRAAIAAYLKAVPARPNGYTRSGPAE